MVTVLNNAQGLEEGLNYSNQSFNRIMQHAQNQNQLAMQNNWQQSQAAQNEMTGLMPYYNKVMISGSDQEKNDLENAMGTLRSRITMPFNFSTDITANQNTYLRPVPGLGIPKYSWYVPQPKE